MSETSTLEAVQQLKGTKQTISGRVFKTSKIYEPTQYDVLDVRFNMEKEHPTFELLLKNEDMPKAKWSGYFLSFGSKTLG